MTHVHNLIHSKAKHFHNIGEYLSIDFGNNIIRSILK